MPWWATEVGAPRRCGSFKSGGHQIAIGQFRGRCRPQERLWPTMALRDNSVVNSDAVAAPPRGDGPPGNRSVATARQAIGTSPGNVVNQPATRA